MAAATGSTTNWRLRPLPNTGLPVEGKEGEAAPAGPSDLSDGLAERLVPLAFVLEALVQHFHHVHVALELPG